DIRNFTKHYLDPTSGFYTSALDKIKQGELSGSPTPYVDPSFKFPDYKTFYAAEIGLYNQNGSPSPTSSPPIQSTPSSITTQDVDNAIGSGMIVPPSSGGVVEPTPVVPSPSPLPSTPSLLLP